jgi:hypothetical protein
MSLQAGGCCCCLLAAGVTLAQSTGPLELALLHQVLTIVTTAVVKVLHLVLLLQGLQGGLASCRVLLLLWSRQAAVQAAEGWTAKCVPSCPQPAVGHAKASGSIKPLLNVFMIVPIVTYAPMVAFN